MLTILIADDEQHIREGIANSIKWEDLHIDKVLLAVDGKQALQIAEESKIDILLSDIRMPVIGGIELSKKMLEKYPDCIIIFMSAYSDKEYLMSAIKLKANNYIEKPLQINKLKEALDEAIKSYNQNEYSKVRSIMVEDNYRISMPLIKNEIALLATNKSTDMNLLLDCIKNEMLEINANASYITVIIRTVDYFSEDLNERKLKSEVYELFSHFTKILSLNNLQYFYGTRDNEEFIIHIYTSTNLVSLNQKQVFSILNQWFCQINSQNLFAAIGTVAPNFTQIYKSYNAAKTALNKCFFRGYGSIVCYSHDITKVALIEKEIIEQFNEILESGKIEPAFQSLHDFSSQLRKYENANVDDIRNIYWKLMSQLLNNLQGYGVSAISRFDNDNSLRNEIHSIQTINELENLCNQLLEIYFDTIKKIQGVKSISMIINYIEKNYSKKTLDINQISENTYLSPAYLCTYFKRETGKTINQYITDYRLSRAADILKDKKHRISEVAGLIGYDDNYFARIFKKKFGISPSEYKERFGMTS